MLPLYAKIADALQDEPFEVIFVNDGSTDNTMSNILSIADQRVRLIEFRKNYGQSAALAAGIRLAEGEFIVTMDGDLQNDPADIPAMIAAAQEGGYDLVAGIRVNRKDDFLSEKYLPTSPTASSCVRPG